MASEENTGSLKEEPAPNPVNHSFEPDPRPYLTESELCNAPHIPPPGGDPQVSQFPAFDEAPGKQRPTYGEAYGLQPPRYEENARQAPPAYHEATATPQPMFQDPVNQGYDQTPQPMFHDPMNHGYDQPQYHGHQYTTTTTAVIVAQPRPGGPIILTQSGPDLTIPAIFACIFCCWPLGIAAIVYASKAKALRREGNAEGAKSMTRVAGTLLALSVILGIVCYVLIYMYRDSLYGRTYNY